MDHTLANIGMLEYILKKGAKGTMIDEHNIIEVINSDTVIKKCNMHLSFVPIGKAEGVTLENLKYTLDNYDLEFSESLAISNEFIDGDGIVKIKKGSLIVIKSGD